MIKICAAHRLLAQTISNETISDHGGRVKCKALTKHLLKYPRLYKSVGSNDGIELMVSNHIFDTLVLVKDSMVIGYLEVQHNYYDGLKVRRVIHSVYVDTAYRGKRLGIVLYAGAIHLFKHIASDALIAVNAVRTWYALSKCGYNVKLWNNTFGKPVAFEWETGIPYIMGKSMEATTEEFVFYV